MFYNLCSSCQQPTHSCSCNTAKTDNINYTGPNLTCSGVDTNDNLTLVIQKLNDAICNPTLLPGGLLRTLDGLPLDAIPRVISDNTNAPTILKLSTDNILITTIENKGGPIISVPAVTNNPTGGVPDALASIIRGHNGVTESTVSGHYVTMQGNRNVGFAVTNLFEPIAATNSFGFDVAFKDTSTTNTIIRGRLGTTVVFNVSDQGVLNAAQLRLNALNTPPANGTDTGAAGEIRIANGFIYVCVATNLWQRAALIPF